MTTTDRPTGKPSNFVAQINGHDIYRAADGVTVNLWSPGVGFWALGVREEFARQFLPTVSEVTVAPAKKQAT